MRPRRPFAVNVRLVAGQRAAIRRPCIASGATASSLGAIEFTRDYGNDWERTMPETPDLKESFSNLAKAVIESERKNHAGFVMNIAAILEYDLERSIRTKMRPIGKKLTERLFKVIGR